MNKELLEKIKKELSERESEMIEIRRYLHENPELSFHETKTAAYISEYYKGKDCLVRTNVGGNGILVDIKGKNPGKSIALRADFDALPIQEDTGLPYSSKNPGVMHACGHDGHTAYLLVLADVLIKHKDEFDGLIRIIHQHGEEASPGGALGMIADGCLDGIDTVLGLHLIGNAPLGDLSLHPGPAYTGMAVFLTKIQGKGGHGAAPHTSNDPIVAGANFVMALQTIVSRRLDPAHTAVVTVGSFDGKGAVNIIKDSVQIDGGIRLLDESDRAYLQQEFTRILEGICQTYNCTYELDYENGYPVLINDVDFTNNITNVLKENPVKNTRVYDGGYLTFSEDFAYYSHQRPSCFISLGAAPKDGELFPHHHSKFRIAEESLLISANTIATITLDFLS